MQLLKKLSIAEKILITAFMVVVTVGLLSAEAYLFVTHTGLDGKAGVTLKDIEISYYGDRDSSKIQSALPAMLPNAGIPQDQWPQIQGMVHHWVAGGATKAEYDATVKPFIDTHCLACHSEAMSKQLHNPPLQTYEEVQDVAKVNTGMSYSSMMMGGMIHLTVLSVIFLIAGSLLIRTSVSKQIKAILVVIPFLAMLTDYSGWYLTHMNPAFAIMVLIGGGLSCPIAMLEMGIAFLDMWFGLPGFLKGDDVEA